MSLILDALKRAERERNADAVPAPGEVSVPVAGGPRPGRRRWLLIGGATVAVLVAVGVTWTLLGGGKRKAPAPATAQLQPQAQPPPIMARPAPPVYVPPVIPGTEAVASLDDLTDESLPEAEPAPATPAPAPAPTQPQAQPQQQPQAQAPQPEPTPPSEEPPPAESPPPEIPPALTQQAPLRKFREMPPDYRADFPALKIEIHVYESAVAKRFVMVNGKRYRQGERMNEGPQVVEIVPEGIVFEYRGEKVLYTLSR